MLVKKAECDLNCKTIRFERVPAPNANLSTYVTIEIAGRPAEMIGAEESESEMYETAHRIFQNATGYRGTNGDVSDIVRMVLAML